MTSQLEFSDIKHFFRRRKLSFSLVFIAIFFASVFIAYTLPPLYRSEATILIEDQQIPTDVVRPTVTGYVEERIKVVSQNVLVRDKLLEIINRFDLYEDEQKRMTKNALVRRFRKSIEIETISASVTNKRTGKSMDATVAFSIAFHGPNREKVQAVTNELAQLFLREDSKAREQRSSVTADFFQEELESLKSQIDEYEKRISEFKTKHIGELPENSRMNWEAIARLERERDRIEMEIDSATERKIYLEGQLAKVEPHKPVVLSLDGNRMALSPEDRLKSLKMSLISMQTSLSEKHPDIRKLKREIRDLESSLGASADVYIGRERLAEQKLKLDALEGRLGPEHPDVLRAQREVELLSQEIARAESSTASLGEGSSRAPDNPVFINILTQIRSTEAEIESLRANRAQVNQSISEYERRIGMAPVVEKGYNELTRDYESAKGRYKDLLNQYMQARVAQVMEDKEKGERFILKDPAYLPEKPFKPNRPPIMILGFILGAGAGFGLAAGREFMDRSVKSVEELSALTGLPVLSVVSQVETWADRRRKYFKRFLWFFAGMGLVAICVVIVDGYVMPLDQIAGKFQARMARSGLTF
jgi:uncharacterized protein involved in exopolysaccharide biosynthesis